VSTGLRRFVTGTPQQAAPPGTRVAPAPADRAVRADRTAPADRVAADPAEAADQTAPATGAATAGAADRAPEERCEFCAAAITTDHGHVADLESSSLMCACRACYLLFTHSGAGQTRQQPRPAGHPQPGQARQAGRARYRAVPDRYRSDRGHPLTAAEWDALEIPVGLAFFLRSSASADTTAFYPSPAGATECRLDIEAWARIAAGHPLLGAAAADVEAILISRGEPDQGGVQAFLVPIDACYELAGRMRLLWRGFDGGAEARDAVASFLEGVRERAVDLGQER
jgi:hypothetical protein